MTLTVAVVVFGMVAFVAAMHLLDRHHKLKPPTTAYCRHPSNQPFIKHIGGGEYLCSCRHCPDLAIIEAPNRESARFQYSAHPCAAMPAPSIPPRK